ncbi:hypothetical protein BU17DRAFT_63062 [Hysterangium stoloniferum]|nr:hypothetical protein BU17DRAFT_63062 [Hysterangium stoloniferum]
MSPDPFHFVSYAQLFEVLQDADLDPKLAPMISLLSFYKDRWDAYSESAALGWNKSVKLAPELAKGPLTVEMIIRYIQYQVRTRNPDRITVIIRIPNPCPRCIDFRQQDFSTRVGKMHDELMSFLTDVKLQAVDGQHRLKGPFGVVNFRTQEKNISSLQLQEKLDRKHLHDQLVWKNQMEQLQYLQEQTKQFRRLERSADAIRIENQYDLTLHLQPIVNMPKELSDLKTEVTAGQFDLISDLLTVILRQIGLDPCHFAAQMSKREDFSVKTRGGSAFDH